MKKEKYFSEDVKNKLLELKEYYKSKGINLPYVFVSKYHGKYKQAGNSWVANSVRNAGKLIGIDNLAPHSLRRTSATLMYHNNVDMLTISQILNHESTQTTQIYLQINKSKLKTLKDSVAL